MNDLSIRTSMGLTLLLAAGAGPVPADPSEPVLASVLVPTHVLTTEAEGNLVALAAGQDAGLRVGAQFWVFSSEGVAADGEILMVTPDRCVGQSRRPVRQPLENQSAVVLDPAHFSRLRDFLPESVSLQGTIRRPAPGRKTAWIDLGLRDSDGVLVRRIGLPIARGTVELLENKHALVSLRPLVSNALAETGDTIELWPSPGDQRQGRLSSAVLDVRPSADGPLLTLIGTARDGLQVGRMVDLYRTDRYVGAAVIEQAGDPLSAARLIEAASVQTPKIGDVAVVRPGPEASGFPLGAAIFKVAGDDYCLVAAGESDGVQVGERWVVRRPLSDDPTRRRVVAELEVTTVKFYHFGATVHMLDAETDKVLPWEWAERVDPPWPHWAEVGQVVADDPTGRWAVAEVLQAVELRPGTIVRWATEIAPTENDRLGPRPRGAGIVIHSRQRRVFFYVPPGWGPVESLSGAQLEIRATLLPANAPAP